MNLKIRIRNLKKLKPQITRKREVAAEGKKQLYTTSKR